jgi:CheY-like chemotaxis protein
MVDDERDQLTLAKANLENSDPRMKISVAESPSTAINHLRTYRTDCVVSDYSMPEMNGVQLHSSIRDQNIPYILYTSRGSEEVAKDAFSVGIDDYVKKDVSLSHYNFLARRIQVAVDKKRSESWYLTYSKKKFLNGRIWRV